MIERFNDFLAHVCSMAPPQAVELDMYRSYAAGAFDALLISTVIAVQPQELAGNLMNMLAINVRDAVLAGIEDLEFKERVRREITGQLFIREEECHGN